MGETITLTAADGHHASAYLAGDGERGLVVIQEIFGVNGHIRNTADRFAAEGFTVVAPALFDRIGPDIELGYTAEDVDKGRELKCQVSTEDALAVIAAAVDELAAKGHPVAVVGYCWGGSLAWASATRLKGLSAAVGYYGGEVAKMREEQPGCPVMLHFGEQDHAIPMDDVDLVRGAHPGVPLHVYPAGHGFSCDERGSYHEASHRLALTRTLEFLRAQMPG